jgi:hypothetical protein
VGTVKLRLSEFELMDLGACSGHQNDTRVRLSFLLCRSQMPMMSSGESQMSTSEMAFPTAMSMSRSLFVPCSIPGDDYMWCLRSGKKHRKFARCVSFTLEIRSATLLQKFRLFTELQKTTRNTCLFWGGCAQCNLLFRDSSSSRIPACIDTGWVPRGHVKVNATKLCF